MAMTHPENIPEDRLLPLVTDGATVVTVNRRLARNLFDQYTDHQIRSGHAVWETPDILPYAAFLRKMADQAVSLQKIESTASPMLLLSSVQERHLWTQIILHSKSGAHLLNITEAANLARQAWEIMHAWQIPVSEIRQLPGPETTVFLKWAESFEARCEKNRWVDSAALPAKIAGMIASGTLPPPKTVVFAGFDEFTPGEKTLLDAFSAAGGRVFVLKSPLKTGHAARHEFADAASEAAAAACWARSLVEKGVGRIGIIVPDLQARRREMIRVFDDEFHPGRVLSLDQAPNRLYNISMGEALYSLPVISAAFKMLVFAMQPMDVNQYSAFLCSEYIGGASAEGSRRAVLDARLRKDNVSCISYAELFRRITDGHHPRFFICPALSARLKDFLALMDKQPEQQHPSQWARAFSLLLDALGWPGDRPLSSIEFQTLQAWRAALSEFCGLDRTGAETDLHTALSDFKTLLSAQTFQPESADAPVQIMGVLEAAGEHFDHLWIMGMHDGQWPKPADPNPFLPVGVQRKYDVAHSSAGRECRFAKTITDRLLQSADHIVVSYPAAQGDAQLFPSPLVTHLAESGPIEFENRSANWRAQIAASAEMEKIEDMTGPEIPENAGARGGTGLLKAQALCPFSAFAQYRLCAEGLETPVSGLSARDRGTLVHGALEYLWQDLASLSGLLSRAEDALGEAVRDAVDRSIAMLKEKHPEVFTPAFTRLEQERLVALMHEWLGLERQRGDFSVADREKRIEMVIGGISLKAFADRIDKTDSGLVIIDYKTGTTSESDWFSERLTEPQLPLYSTMAAEPVAGVLFAQVRRGDSRYRGIAFDETVAPGIRGLQAANKNSQVFSSMDEIMNCWRIKIESLAMEVRRGQAAVAPVSKEISCRYCDLGPLCRIGEADLLEE